MPKGNAKKLRQQQAVNKWVLVAGVLFLLLLLVLVRVFKVGVGSEA